MAKLVPERMKQTTSSVDRVNPIAAVVYAIVGFAVAWWLAKQVFGFVLFWIKLGVFVALVGGIWWGIRKLGRKAH